MIRRPWVESPNTRGGPLSYRRSVDQPQRTADARAHLPAARALGVAHSWSCPESQAAVTCWRLASQAAVAWRSPATHVASA